MYLVAEFRSGPAGQKLHCTDHGTRSMKPPTGDGRMAFTAVHASKHTGPDRPGREQAPLPEIFETLSACRHLWKLVALGVKCLHRKAAASFQGPVRIRIKGARVFIRAVSARPPWLSSALSVQVMTPFNPIESTLKRKNLHLSVARIGQSSMFFYPL